MRGAISIVAMLLASSVWADSPDISARRLLASWKDQDPSTRMLAEVIASAFAGGMSWAGTIEGHPLYCPPPTVAFTGNQAMSILESFIVDHPETADKTYGLALSAGLRQGVPLHAGLSD